MSQLYVETALLPGDAMVDGHVVTQQDQGKDVTIAGAGGAEESKEPLV